MVDVKNFMNGMNEVKMNEVIVNGVRFELNDEQTTVVLAKISQLLNGVVPSQTVSQSTNKTVFNATEPKSYEPKEDITVRYFTDKTDDGKYFINYKATTVDKDGNVKDRFKTPQDVKKLIKGYDIKLEDGTKKHVYGVLDSIKGIKEIDNHFTDKNGKNVTYTVYGFSTKKACDDKLASLKTVFTVSERKEVQ